MNRSAPSQWSGSGEVMGEVGEDPSRGLGGLFQSFPDTKVNLGGADGGEAVVKGAPHELVGETKC